MQGVTGNEIIFLVLFFSIKLFSCNMNTSSDLRSELNFQEGMDKDSYLRGRSLVMTECIGCHRFYSPDEYTSEQWVKIINRKKKRLSLSENQAKDINLYFKIESSSE